MGEYAKRMEGALLLGAQENGGSSMISDTFFDAIEDLKNYTEDPYWQSVYGEATIAEIEDFMLRMDALREKLDALPGGGADQTRAAQER